MDTVRAIREQFRTLKAVQPDATHLELLGVSFLANEPFIFGTPNQEYIDAEIEWYESCSGSVDTLFDMYGKRVAIWDSIADDDGYVNSNYGQLIYTWRGVSESQYMKVFRELKRDPQSRKAVMIYTDPKIHDTWNYNGMSDFYCTNVVQYQIRHGFLTAVVQMRSNDAVFGYNNDYAWQRHVLEKLANDLKVQPGNIIWQVGNMHVYERHLELV